MNPLKPVKSHWKPKTKAVVSFFLVQNHQDNQDEDPISDLIHQNKKNKIDFTKKTDLSLNFLQIKSNTKSENSVKLNQNQNYRAFEEESDTNYSDILEQYDLNEINKVRKKCDHKKYEFLLRLFVNFGYCICIIPFYFSNVVGFQNFEIKQNFVQHTICLIFCTTASFVTFTVAIAKIGSIHNNPLVIFNFWSYSVFCGWCFTFVNLFWRKRHLLLALVNKEQQSLSQGSGATANKWAKRFATLYFFGVIVEELFHKSVFYLWPKVYGMQSAAEVYTGKALYALLMRNNSDPVPWPQITKVHLTISVWHFVGWQIFGEIKSLFYIFVTFNSIFLIGKIKRNLRHLKESHRKCSKMSQKLDSQMIWDHFVEVRWTVETINELIDLPVMGIYLILVPFLSSAFIRRWDSEFIEYKVLMVFQFVWPMIALVAGAEATRMGEKFMKAVKDKSELLDNSNGKVGSAYFVYENACLAIRGGKYFKLSYGFLGATLSVIMTYGLVILCFLHDDFIKKGQKH